MPHLSYQGYTYDALHDSLTGLYNNTAFRMLVKDADRYHTALLIAEVTEATQILSEQGQIAAEAIMKHAASYLRRSFRPVDHICRINSSEFAIIMSRVDSSIQEQVSRKIERMTPGTPPNSCGSRCPRPPGSRCGCRPTSRTT